MNDQHEHKQIQVKVVFPSAHHPFEHPYPPNTLLGEIKDDAIKFFNLREVTEGGNQIRYFLYHDNQRIEDMQKPLSSVADDHTHVDFRLAKEAIAG